MKNKIIPAFSLFCLVSFTGCSSADRIEDNRIDIVTAFSNQKVLKASDYFSEVRYVPLETTDESIIGKDAEMQFLGDKILITTAQGQCLLFDKNTGKYLTTVGHKGEDPEGYSSATAWINDQTGMIYLDSKKAWVAYNRSGQFEKRITIPDQLSGASFSYWDPVTFVAHTTGMFSSGKEEILFFNEDSILSRLPIQEAIADKFDVSAINSVSVFKGGEEGYQKFGAPNLKGIMEINFNEPDQGYMQLMGMTHFWHTKGDLYYKGDFNDTIYQVKEHQLIPAKILDMGEYSWPYEECFNKKHDRSFIVTHILECDDYLLLRFVQYIYNTEKRTAYTTILDKSKGIIQIAPVEKGFKDDLSHFIPLQPYTVSSSGEYGGIIQAFDVVEWFEDNQGKTISPQIRHLQEIDEEDNPVLVLLNK